MNKSQEPNKLALFFSLACQDGNFDSFKKAYAKCRLMDHSYLETFYPIHSAAKAKSMPIVQFLIGRQFTVNLQNQIGQTPLFVAASVGSNDIVKLLIKSGADVNLADSRGWTPLMVAVKNSDQAIVKTFMEDGKVDLNLKDKYGKTAFDKVSSVKILNVLRSVNDEETMLKSYVRPVEHGPKGGETRDNDMFVLRDLVNQELDTITKEDYSVITTKLKEKFLLHSRTLGLNVSEKAFEKVLADLDKKLEVYKPLLLEEATKNFNQKYKKFVREIEKYLNLRLNIILTANNQNNNNMILHHLDESVASLENSRNFGESSLGSSIREREEQQYLNSMRSPNQKLFEEVDNLTKSASTNQLPPHSHSHADYSANKSRNRNFESPTRKSTHLCRQNVEEWGSAGRDNARSRSPILKRFRSEGPSPSLTKKEETQKLYQVMIKQTDKMMRVITERAEVALDKIFDEKLAAIKENIDKELQQKFKKLVADMKTNIELKINTAVREKLKAQKQQNKNTPRGESPRAVEKKAEDKTEASNVSKNKSPKKSPLKKSPLKKSPLKKSPIKMNNNPRLFAEIQNRPTSSYQGQISADKKSQKGSETSMLLLQSSGHNPADTSFTRRKEEFIRRKMEKRLLSPPSRKDITPKRGQPVFNTTADTGFKQNTSSSIVNSRALDMSGNQRTGEKQTPANRNLLQNILQDTDLEGYTRSSNFTPQLNDPNEQHNNVVYTLSTNSNAGNNPEKLASNVRMASFGDKEPDEFGMRFDQLSSLTRNVENQGEIDNRKGVTFGYPVPPHTYTIPIERTSERLSGYNKRVQHTNAWGKRNTNKDNYESDVVPSQGSLGYNDSNEQEQYEMPSDRDSLERSHQMMSSYEKECSSQEDVGNHLDQEKESQLRFIRAALDKASYFGMDPANMSWGSSSYGKGKAQR